MLLILKELKKSDGESRTSAMRRARRRSGLFCSAKRKKSPRLSDPCLPLHWQIGLPDVR
jgi:hypothetical protein